MRIFEHLTPYMRRTGYSYYINTIMEALGLGSVADRYCGGCVAGLACTLYLRKGSPRLPATKGSMDIVWV